MKKILFPALLLLASQHYVSAQTTYIDANNIKALVPSTPLLFWGGTGASYFHVPKTGTASTVFSSTPWIGGLNNSNLYLAAETYRQNGMDFQSGPVSNTYTASTKWNTVKVSKATIETFKATPSQWSTPPDEIANWPAHGDTANGQAMHLAPFVNVGGDPGLYEPAFGDYPLIKGDQCIYYIFNDDRVHGETGGQKMRAEIHRMVYAYADTSSFLNNTVFVEYEVFNRSTLTYDSTTFSVYTDFDLGSYNDDYVGTDSLLNMVYAYNGEATDNVYGTNPPAEGMIMLNKPLITSMYYTNDMSRRGNPAGANEYYNLMNAVWRDDSPLVYGDSGISGTSRTLLSYTGSACDAQGWTEASGGNLPGDRRMLASANAFEFAPGSSFNVTFAYLYARGTSGAESSVCALHEEAAKLINWHKDNTTGIENATAAKQALFRAYPNPAEGFIQVELSENTTADITVYDLNGRMISSIVKAHGTIRIDDLKAGLYLVKADHEKTSTVKKIMVR